MGGGGRVLSLLRCNVKITPTFKEYITPFVVSIKTFAVPIKTFAVSITTASGPGTKGSSTILNVKRTAPCAHQSDSLSRRQVSDLDLIVKVTVKGRCSVEDFR